jgi:hypothetical protein
MPLVRCAECNRRTDDQPSQVTFAWRRADLVRVAYRCRLCRACLAERCAHVLRRYEGEERLTCPGCGIDTEDDFDAVFTTAYIPSYGKVAGEAPFCGACAAIYRNWVLDKCQLLEDTLGATGGPQQHPSGDEVLRAMGIEPRPVRSS